MPTTAKTQKTTIPSKKRAPAKSPTKARDPATSVEKGLDAVLQVKTPQVAEEH